MDTSREHDQSVERLLRQSLQARRDAGMTDSCLDAETLAAWVDDGLSGAALEVAQSHVADCARCQSLVGAMARIDSAAHVSQPVAEPAARRWLAWTVPLTAAAAALVLWIAVPRDTGAPAATSAATEAGKQAAGTTAQEAPAVLDNQPPVPVAGNAARMAESAAGSVERPAPAPQLRKDNERFEADAAAPLPSAPPATLAAREAQSAFIAADRAGIEIVSPDPSVRWRIAGAVVERSTNGGAGFEAVPTGVAAELTAGAAPSTSVCWVVGRGGVVLLSIDGRTWRRVVFPESTDLSSVEATDARTASVTTSDGRIFSTSDGGVTWGRR